MFYIMVYHGRISSRKDTYLALGVLRNALVYMDEVERIISGCSSLRLTIGSNGAHLPANG